MSSTDTTAAQGAQTDRGARQLRSLTDILDALEHAASDGKVSVRNILDEMGVRSFAPLILAPAMILISPISGIPGLPTIGALFIMLLSVQKLIGRSRTWLPEFLLKRQVASDKFRKALNWLRKPARWVDAHTAKRLKLLVTAPMDRVNILIIMAICVVIPFLEVLPFVTSFFAVAISLFAVGMLARDGLFALLGYIWTGAAVVGVIWLISG